MKKRKRVSEERQVASKRQCLNSESRPKHVLRLRKYYNTVEPLVDHILSALPTTSKLRRRRIAETCKGDTELASLLQNVLVAGTQTRDLPVVSLPDLRKDLNYYTQSQKAAESSAVKGNCRVLDVRIALVIAH